MLAGKGYLSISRNHSISNSLRKFSILIDDKVIDTIKSGENKKYELPIGNHIIRIGLDFYKSKPLYISVNDGETLALECGDKAPKTLSEVFSFHGMEKSLKVLTSPADYLYIKLRHQNFRQNSEVFSTKPSKKENSEKLKHFSVFLSYRREDSRDICGRIGDSLSSYFGKDAIFRDVDSIPIGSDFRTHIRKTIDKANVLIAIIGPKWLNASVKGERRLDLPEDYVRLEIESALQKAIPIFPVLIDRATMPQPGQLPEPITELAYRNALFIPREPFFHTGVEKLIHEIEKLAPQKEMHKFCTKCGEKLNPDHKFCTECGTTVGTNGAVLD